jgi:hypothetical protein
MQLRLTECFFNAKFEIPMIYILRMQRRESIKIDSMKRVDIASAYSVAKPLSLLYLKIIDFYIKPSR